MKQTLKEIIAKELEHFVLKEGVKPESIKIEVWYDGCVARINIDQEKLEDREVKI